MNPNGQGLPSPNNPQPQIPAPQVGKTFTKKALETKFSFNWTRQQLVVLVNMISGQQMQLGDPRARILAPLLDEIDRTAFNALTDSDYEQPEKPANPQIATKASN